MVNPLETESERIIRALQSGAGEALEDLYASYRDDFFKWANRRFPGNRQDFEDAWQEAVIAFYEQAASGRLTTLRHSARTWLFAVGYKRLLQYNRKMKRILRRDPIDQALLHDVELIEFSWDEPSTFEQALVERSMKELTLQCREILVKRFYEEKKIPDIRVTLGYNSENSTSAALSRCLRRLKELVTKLADDLRQMDHGR